MTELEGMQNLNITETITLDETNQTNQNNKQLKTPRYIRNATKAYYDRKKDDPEFKKKKADNAREWRQKNKEKHSQYQTEWKKKQKEIKDSSTS
jgi:hypothetical protein